MNIGIAVKLQEIHRRRQITFAKSGPEKSFCGVVMKF